MFDNLNVYAGVKYQQLHNQPKMLNYTVVYLACNPETQLRRRLIRSDVDISKIQQIVSDDIIPTPQMKQIWTQAAHASFNQTMLRYCGPAMSKYRKDGLPLDSWRVDPIYQVPVQNSKVIPLPVFQKNEARVSELKDVLHGITKTLGYDTTNRDDFKMLEEIKILFGGDELSVRNARIAMAHQMEALPQASLQYIELVAGLFHFQLQVLMMLIQNHYRSPQDPNSISQWMTLLQSDARIWDTKRNIIKDFHACHTLFNIILDAHLLTLFDAKYNATICDVMLTLPEHHNWRKSIKHLSQLILDVTMVGEMMSKPEDTWDRQYENVIL